jgi:hypothetical protein
MQACMGAHYKQEQQRIKVSYVITPVHLSGGRKARIHSHAGCHWLAPLIPVLWKTKIWRIVALDQPGQQVCKIPSQWKKAGHRCACLSSQLQHKVWEDYGPG